ncbi:MAG: hypothetical protein ABFS45_00215 [Pseudomonadota bacterium]
MNCYLSVSTAAKMAGVSRSHIQKKIRKGKLSTFEGKVSVSDLILAYPDIELEDTTVLERMSRIQRNATHKTLEIDCPKEQLMAAELGRLRLELADSKAEIQRYHKLVLGLKQRLMDIQEEDDCTRRQRLVLQALISWMLQKVEQQA